MTAKTPSRKLDHINIVTKKEIEAKEKSTYFEYVDFVHQALPEIDLDTVNTATEFLGKKLSMPLLITGMTGGHEAATEINQNLAKAAESFGVGMGLGSQRAMIEHPELAHTYQVRTVAPTMLLIGNIGAPQIEEYSIEVLKKLVADTGADALAIHLNTLQEAVMTEGEATGAGFSKSISKIVKELGVPVMVKETGAGISQETAKLLIKAKVSAIDTGGAGGTSFSAVEAVRAGKSTEFWDWGIPTAASILEIRKESKTIPISATGGIRTGLEIAKAIALGANVCAAGGPFIKAAQKSEDAVLDVFTQFQDDLKTAMFLVGAKNIAALAKTQIMLTGKLFEWATQRNINLPR